MCWIKEKINMAFGYSCWKKSGSGGQRSRLLFEIVGEEGSTWDISGPFSAKAIDIPHPKISNSLITLSILLYPLISHPYYKYAI
ncbi:MAG: hypothetical protein NC928_01075 [Candidatus Omnitrophica bacterium]|nr:hypothetical protein [Candidatus Omnitrophota bacterium]